MRNTRRLSISELAVEQRLTYRGAWERALRGDFGQVERQGGRLFVVQRPERTQTPRPDDSAPR